MGISNYDPVRDNNANIAPGNIRTKEPVLQQIVNSIRQLMADLAGAATVTNDNAAVGRIGEYGSQSVAAGAGVALVTGTAKTVTSILLQPGDYEVTGNVGFDFAATTNYTVLAMSISQAANTHDTTAGAYQAKKLTAGDVPGASSFLHVFGSMTIRVSLAVPTTVYLIASATFTVSTLGAYGLLAFRRMR